MKARCRQDGTLSEAPGEGPSSSGLQHPLAYRTSLHLCSFLPLLLLSVFLLSFYKDTGHWIRVHAYHDVILINCICKDPIPNKALGFRTRTYLLWGHDPTTASSDYDAKKEGSSGEKPWDYPLRSLLPGFHQEPAMPWFSGL